MARARIHASSNRRSDDCSQIRRWFEAIELIEGERSSQVIFAEERESLSKKNLTSEIAIVHRERNTWITRSSHQHGIDETNVELGAEQMQAQLCQGLTMADLDDDEIELAERVAVLAQDVSSGIGV